ncbi:LacI family transcriptional regulator [Arthrobacter sp. ERGS1:01]|uniref:LacI family DNA-binding transcriptional regulator n=1 Tax=Arthrobacter sp. ERGS1:01 TaxID=1704044 RepID=UPI0006B4760D|nr:LacI family DNA-binding transcriptional regulator [Arthrobacter sp. ERGS1:01]ALE07431.1 LacI family transcriptional regulator [Arthrobacter sp. ERGS1:01]
MAKTQRATIQDVAVLSGLSICTVSRALRNLPNVSEKAQRLVAEAAQKLDYKASSAASRLAGGSTGSIAIIAPTATAWFFAQVVEAAEEVFADSGFDTVLISLRNSPSVRQRILGDLAGLAQRVDGVLLLNIDLTAEEIAEVAGSGLAVASLGMTGVPWDNVGIDNEHAAWLATSHLLELGHWNLGVLTGRELNGNSVQTSADRLKGFNRAAAENDLTVHPDLVVCADSSIEGGRRAMTELIAHRTLPSAIFAECDEAAFGALMALREHGLSAPKDVSIVGLDDHPMSWFMGLTTMSQPVADQGAFAANLLCERLQNPAGLGEPGHHLMATKLIERKTTRRKR